MVPTSVYPSVTWVTNFILLYQISVVVFSLNEFETSLHKNYRSFISYIYSLVSHKTKEKNKSFTLKNITDRTNGKW